MMRGFCNTFFFCLYFSFTAFAQKESSASFERISVENGLSSNWIQTIFQDSKGFVWIGTRDGLNKAYGHGFIQYNYAPGDSSSLADNFVTSIAEDGNGDLWIGTLNGLSRFCYYSNSFINFSKEEISREFLQTGQINVVRSDHEKNIWFGSQGGGIFKVLADPHNIDNKSCLSKGSYSFRHFSVSKHFEEGEKEEYVHSIFFDSNEVWVGMLNDFYLLEINNDQIAGIQSFNKSFKQMTPVSGLVTLITKNEKAIWALVVDKYLIKMALKDPLATRLEHQYVPEIFPIDSKQIIPSQVLIDRNNNLWIGTNYEGLFKTGISTITQTSIWDIGRFKHSVYDLKSIGSNQILSLMEDKSGLIWTGTDMGISIYSPAKENFFATGPQQFFNSLNNLTVTSISQSDNALLIGTDDDGVFGFDLQKNRSFSIANNPGKPKIIFNNTIVSLLSDEENNLWIGTAEGLNWISSGNIISTLNGQKTLSPSDIGFDNALSLPGSIIFSLLQDKEEKFWVGTQTGAYWRNKNEKTYNLVRYGPKENELSHPIIYCLYEDSENHIWLGTENGLNELNKKTGIIQKYFNSGSNRNSLSSNRISFIIQDKNKIYWIGTNGGGLNKFDKKKNEFKSFTTKNGLPNNSINGIVDDESGNLWISTNNGLSKFNKQEESFINYDANDGLKSIGFFRGAARKLNDGKLIFGGSSGFNAFFPDNIYKNTFIPNIIIVDFKISDRSVYSNEYPDIKSQFLGGKMIELNPHQNNVSFEFAALNFINSAKNQFKYRLEGYDKEFISSGNFRFATYTNLDPGDYTFHVIGSNNDGVWNTTGTKINIYLAPPWYKTWWFKIAAGLILASLIYIITYMRIRAIHERKEKELVQHSAKMKEQFLANMSHEIRTPMNAIMGMTRLMLDNSPRDDQKKYLKAIRQSSDNLLVIINDILDFSKIESGKMELNFIPFSVSELLQNVYETMHLKAEEKGLEFTVKVENEIPDTVLGDPVRLSEILINLIGNAVKFTARGNVRVTCRNMGNYIDPLGMVINDISSIMFSVADTGIGIPEDKIEGIFESFTQASSDTTRKYGGTGLGLTISKHLVEMHGGKIIVNSKPNVGTVFSFTLPLEISSSKSVSLREIHTDEIPVSLSLLKILLVEDNELNQVVAIDTLQGQLPGITIDVAENGKIALEKIKANNYDLVLMDIQMPEMDGYTATKIIRRDFPDSKKNIKIIAITAGALKSEVQKCFECGMNDYISKPFTPEGLIQKLSDLFPVDAS